MISALAPFGSPRALRGAGPGESQALCAVFCRRWLDQREQGAADPRIMLSALLREPIMAASRGAEAPVAPPAASPALPGSAPGRHAVASLPASPAACVATEA